MWLTPPKYPKLAILAVIVGMTAGYTLMKVGILADFIFHPRLYPDHPQPTADPLYLIYFAVYLGLVLGFFLNRDRLRSVLPGIGLGCFLVAGLYPVLNLMLFLAPVASAVCILRHPASPRSG